jgi:uncharacterized protein YoxC
MGDLILKTRLQDLEKNLHQVQNVLDAVQKRRQVVDDLLKLLARQATALGGADDIVNQVIGRVRQLGEVFYKVPDIVKFSEDLLRQGDKEQPQPAGPLRQIQQEIDAVRQLMYDARKMLTSMQDRFDEINDDKLKDALTGTLTLNAKNWVDDLDVIKTELAAAERSNAADLAAARISAWKNCIGPDFESKRDVFAEYVDFLGGLALRDTGYDESICRLADELISSCSEFLVRAPMPGDTTVPVARPWQSLTIPASQEAMKMTLAQLIRIGFPEWTFWIIPLTAHALGHVLVSQNTDLSDYITAHAADERSRRNLQILVADTFATFTMGPAYACASVLLRLNPFQASSDHDDHPADAKRAYVIFQMLRRMNKAEEEQPYIEIIKTLETEWVEALWQVCAEGQPAQNAPPLTDELAPQPPADKLDQDTLARLDDYVDYLAGYLNKNAVTIRYSADSWSNMTQALGELLKNSSLMAGDLNVVKGTEKLRDVLNAAWAYRVEQHIDVEDLRKAAVRLRAIIDEKKASSSRDGGRRSGSPFGR